MSVKTSKKFVDLPKQDIALSFLIHHKASESSLHEFFGQRTMLVQTEIAAQCLLVYLQFMDPAVASRYAEQSSFEHH